MAYLAPNTHRDRAWMELSLISLFGSKEDWRPNTPEDNWVPSSLNCLYLENDVDAW